MFYRKRILQPITILEKSIQQIEQGNYQQPVYYNTYDEFEKTSLGHIPKKLYTKTADCRTISNSLIVGNEVLGGAQVK
jgi:hypothetical protein